MTQQQTRREGKPGRWAEEKDGGIHKQSPTDSVERGEIFQGLTQQVQLSPAKEGDGGFFLFKALFVRSPCWGKRSYAPPIWGSGEPDDDDDEDDDGDDELLGEVSLLRPTMDAAETHCHAAGYQALKRRSTSTPIMLARLRFLLCARFPLARSRPNGDSVREERVFRKVLSSSSSEKSPL